uniref:Protein kinase n=1 Tax=Marseillevirus LCMAC101 TaxID=2506602 RepID=A0A481YRW2_9VIRU|nr:MAG: protein kinase [Marseillevirus LCMAC101]
MDIDDEDFMTGLYDSDEHSLSDLKERAKMEGIDFPSGATGGEIYEMIGDLLFEGKEKQSDKIKDFYNRDLYLEPSAPKRLTVKMMRYDARLLGIKLNLKEMLYQKIKEYVEEFKDTEEFVIQGKFEFPTRGDMIKIVNDISHGESLTDRSVEEILNRLEKLRFENCGSWYKVTLDHFIGGGAQGNVHRFIRSGNPMVKYAGKEIPLVSTEYDFINVIFATIVKNIIKDTRSPNLMAIEHIYKCQLNDDPRLAMPREHYILNIIDRITCGELSLVLHRLTTKQRISIFLQVFATTMILAIYRIGHLDVHGNNILICRADYKEIRYPILDIVIPVFGFVAVLIDYDFAGIATTTRLWYKSDNFRSQSSLPFSSSHYINKYPGIFILGQIYPLLTRDSDLGDKTPAIKKSPVGVLCTAINNGNWKSLDDEYQKWARGILFFRYNRYNVVLEICKQVFAATFLDLNRKLEMKKIKDDGI